MRLSSEMFRWYREIVSGSYRKCFENLYSGHVMFWSHFADFSKRAYEFILRFHISNIWHSGVHRMNTGGVLRMCTVLVYTISKSMLLGKGALHRQAWLWISVACTRIISIARNLWFETFVQRGTREDKGYLGGNGSLLNRIWSGSKLQPISRQFWWTWIPTC